METGNEDPPQSRTTPEREREREPRSESPPPSVPEPDVPVGSYALPAAPAQRDASEAYEWQGVERALLTMRRTLLLLSACGLLLVAGVLWWQVGPAWSLLILPGLGIALFAWFALGRNWRSWRYAERADDLLISRGVLWRELTVVPYGRMQLVEVTSGPLERKYGLSRLQLHTAAAATDAAIPGLVPAEAERLRDRLTELGEARSAGL